MCNRDRSSYCKLHQAIVENSFETVNQLLEKSTNDINCIALNWGTPLLMALQKNAADSIILCLLQAGSDPNTTYRGNSALHFAISRPNIVLALLKRGANPNLKDRFNCTPLHDAVTNEDLEVVCMLLRYGASASMKSYSGTTPLDEALIGRNFNIATAMMHFVTYDDVNFDFGDYRNTEHILLLEYNDPELFKLYWAKVNHRVLYRAFPDFLLFFCSRCQYDAEHWIECVLLMLKSKIGFELMGWFSLDSVYACKVPNCTFLTFLIINMDKKKIKQKHRLSVLCTIFSLGVETCFHSFELLYELFGFGDELETMIYGGNYTTAISVHQPVALQFPLATLLLPVFETNTFEVHSMSERNHCMIILYLSAPFKFALDTMGLFSIPHLVRDQLFTFFGRPAYHPHAERQAALEKQLCNPLILMNRKSIPTIPSLRELSRDAVRKFIQQSGAVKHPYQFHDIIKGLDVPHYLKDIIRFKRAIY